MNNNSQQKTLALYSKNRYQNKTSATTLAPNSSTHLRHNSNLGMNRRNEYQVRTKFVYLDNITREEIIKYIFDEERKNRKNGKGR